jgi:hypothetical protein
VYKKQSFASFFFSSFQSPNTILIPSSISTMLRKVVITLSPACLALLLQCTAAPVGNNHLLDAGHSSGYGHQLNEAHPHFNAWSGHEGNSVYEHGDPHLLAQARAGPHFVAAGRHQNGYSVVTDGGRHTGVISKHVVDGVPVGTPVHVLSSSSVLRQDDVQHQQHDHFSPMEHDQDNLWAIVGESSRKFKGKQPIEEVEPLQEQERPIPSQSRQKSKGIFDRAIVRADDPDVWMYKLAPSTIRAVKKRFEDLTGEKKRNTTYKRLLLFATQKNALDLLSNDPLVQEAALKDIGIPKSKSKGKRHDFWGKEKARFTRRVEIATGFSHDVTVWMLGHKLNRVMAQMLASNDLKVFQQGVELLRNTPYGRGPKRETM